jgi:acyl carrier protein
MDGSMTSVIRAVLRDHGRLRIDVASLEPDSDLYEAGLTSTASVDVLLALEDRFTVEFPDHMLRRNAFSSIAAIRAALQELGAGDPA